MKNTKVSCLLVSLALTSLLFGPSGAGADDAIKVPAQPGAAESTIGPVYADAPELMAAAGVPRGAVHAFTMASTDSKSYPGIATGQPGAVP